MTTTFLKKYKVLQKIGEGSFSEVLKCQDRQTGVLYAAKRLKKIYQNVSEMLESPEVIAMRKISRHPNILYMIESHYDPLPGKVTLIFELMDMSLYDLVKARKGRNLTEQRVKAFLYQLLKGLEHLHKHGIFHRDIKPENILLKGDIVKLADLGSIRGIYSRPPYTEYISTRWYRSPECLLTTGFYGPKMDVWATGCVYYELLTLKPLFPGSNEVDQISKIHSILGTPHARLVAKFRRHSKSRNCEYFFPNKGGTGVANLLPHVSDGGRDVLKLMLVYDPENRSNVTRLLDHRYFNDLREKDSSPRLSSSFVVPSSARDSSQWRNPVLLSYITSERRRKSKASRTRRQKLGDDDASSKIPRVVASSPNARPTLTSNCSVPSFEKSTLTALDDARKKLQRSWRGNVYATRAQLDTSAATKSQSNDKLPPLKFASKTTVSRESSKSSSSGKRVGMQRVASLASQERPYAGILKSESRSLSSRKNESPSCSFLPQIALRSTARNHHRVQTLGANTAPNENFTTKSFPSNAGLRQTKLATITEQRASSDVLTGRGDKSPQAKSPAKKIAKHEISTPVDSVIQPVKRLRPSLSKASFRRDRL